MKKIDVDELLNRSAADGLHLNFFLDERISPLLSFLLPIVQTNTASLRAFFTFYFILEVPGYRLCFFCYITGFEGRVCT